MTKLTTPIPQDKIGENFVWRDWFQRLSNTVYGTLASQDASNVNITGGAIAPSLVGVVKIVAGTNINVSPSSGTGEVIVSSVNSGVSQIIAGTNVTISPTGGTGAVTINSSGGGGGSTSPPVTYTSDFTLSVPTNWVISNKPGSTCTVTLPLASSYSGYTITIQNYQNQLIVSASNNVVPIGGTSAGSGILNAGVGYWATLVSDGTNWVVMQAVGGSVAVSDLLLENGSYILLENGSRIIL